LAYQHSKLYTRYLITLCVASWVKGGSNLNMARHFLTARERTRPQVMLKQALPHKQTEGGMDPSLCTDMPGQIKPKYKVATQI